ncbi:MAG TPA: hypothetical protein VF113_10625, partial [Stellaceae bacterium]
RRGEHEGSLMLLPSAVIARSAKRHEAISIRIERKPREIAAAPRRRLAMTVRVRQRQRAMLRSIH